jgi:hypothetical protein
MSQINKLGFVDSKLGAPTRGQQTTRVLFNTVIPTTAPTQLSFFKNFQGLTNGQTNLTQNKLDSSESMVIKTIWLAEYADSSGTGNGFITSFGAGTQQTLSIIVGNQTVVKDLPIQFNTGTNGQAFDRLHSNAGSRSNTQGSGFEGQVDLPVEIRLLTDIVIPPQVSFEIRIEGARPYSKFTPSIFVCALNGYGKIFSAGSSF